MVWQKVGNLGGTMERLGTDLPDLTETLHGTSPK